MEKTTRLVGFMKIYAYNYVLRQFNLCLGKFMYIYMVTYGLI